MADWNAIKTEYITTDTSYRKLSAKHGVNATNIAKKASAEGWVEQRNQYVSDTQAKTLKKISNEEVKRVSRLHKVADKVLAKIEKMVDAIDPEYCDPKSLRAISAALKDLKDIQDIKSNLDTQEQQARIANLQRTAGMAEPDIEDNSFVSAELFPDETPNS